MLSITNVLSAVYYLRKKDLPIRQVFYFHQSILFGNTAWQALKLHVLG